MTITYSLHVSEARLCGFPKLLLRWKGSIYKLLYREMLIFIALYTSLSFLYRYILSNSQKIFFENLARYCEKFTDLIPLSFVLGFYVSIVVGRWWRQYENIPWPDRCVMMIAAHVNGNDERGRIIRRTLARYLSLLSALTFQGISTAVKKRFPTLEHFQEAGLMTAEERRVFDDIPVAHGKWWVPAQWFNALAVRARKEGRIKHDTLLQQLLDELQIYRTCCGMLWSYDWISIPLVYTQVVTLAIYTYFLATVMGRQYVHREDIDLYVPVFTLLQFFFYMGWLKVAEQLINPFGEDDDDFELNWCLDRNLQVSMIIVDEMHQKIPKLRKDIYWDETEPQLPYTKSSVNLRTQPHLGSAMTLDVDPEEAEFVPMETIMEEDNDDKFDTDNPNSPDLSNLARRNIPHNDISQVVIRNPHLMHLQDGDNASIQSNSRVKFDFPGAKTILNILMGQSSDSVGGRDTPLKKSIPHNAPDKEQFLPSLALRVPGRHRSCTTSLSEGLNERREELLRGLDTPWRRNFYDVPAFQPNNIPGPSGRTTSESQWTPKAPTEPPILEGQIIQVEDIPPTTPNIPRPASGAVLDLMSASVEKDDKIQNKVPQMPGGEASGESHRETSGEHNSKNETSPFEPSLSEESLNIDANQSTVDSFTQLLSRADCGSDTSNSENN